MKNENVFVKKIHSRKSLSGMTPLFDNGLMHRGFTLIELLVVVLIIGILAAVAVPQYQKAVEKSRLAEGLTIMNSLQKAIDAYILEHGYPSAGVYVNFTGIVESDDTENVPLDVEFGNCSTIKGMTFCATNNFFFYADCSSEVCNIGITRDDWKQYDNDDEYNLPGDNSMGSISAVKAKSTGKWTKNCLNTSGTAAWTAICNDLRTQGWN